VLILKVLICRVLSRPIQGENAPRSERTESTMALTVCQLLSGYHSNGLAGQRADQPRGNGLEAGPDSGIHPPQAFAEVVLPTFR
jgi:hypothetical protein